METVKVIPGFSWLAIIPFFFSIKNMVHIFGTVAHLNVLVFGQLCAQKSHFEARNHLLVGLVTCWF